MKPDPFESRKRYEKGYIDGVLDAVTDILMIIPPAEMDDAFDHIEKFMRNRKENKHTEQSRHDTEL